MRPALRLLIITLAPWALALACVVLARSCVPADANPCRSEQRQKATDELPAIGIEFDPDFGSLET
jgi:hypothetical protein